MLMWVFVYIRVVECLLTHKNICIQNNYIMLMFVHLLKKKRGNIPSFTDEEIK